MGGTEKYPLEKMQKLLTSVSKTVALIDQDAIQQVCM